MGVVRTKVGPTFTTKGFEVCVIGRMVKQLLKGSLRLSSSGRESIYKVACRVKRIIPMRKGNMRMRE